jgi:hypothetical protein
VPSSLNVPHLKHDPSAISSIRKRVISINSIPVVRAASLHPPDDKARGTEPQDELHQPDTVNSAGTSLCTASLYSTAQDSANK